MTTLCMCSSEPMTNIANERPFSYAFLARGTVGVGKNGPIVQRIPPCLASLAAFLRDLGG